MSRLSIIFFIMLGSYLAEAIDPPKPNMQNFIDKLEAQTSELQGGAVAILYKG
jgi:hypothetical protein